MAKYFDETQSQTNIVHRNILIKVTFKSKLDSFLELHILELLLRNGILCHNSISKPL